MTAGHAPSSAGGSLGLIVFAEEERLFAVRRESTRITSLRISLDHAAGRGVGLGALVEQLAKSQLGIEVSYLGMVAGGPPDDERVVVAAVLRTGTAHHTSDRNLRYLSLTQLLGVGDVEYPEHFVTVWRWCESARVSHRLASAIQRAFDTSLAYLDTHTSVENGMIGWNLYQDGGSVGMLSTAEAMLAHLHAGSRGEFIDRPTQTLEALQNPDGGWQVRRSLVGSRSENSVTESTCACLWALLEAGRSVSSRAVRDGISWIEETQLPDGGWPSSRGGGPSVFPTTAALRVLAGLGRQDVVARAVSWLRGAQCPNGGWGPLASAADQESGPSAAYTAYAVIALLKNGVQPGDPVVAKGCEYLLRVFDADRTEPWESTSFMTVVDPETSAWLDFRHFGTPWALAALSLAGHGLDEFAVLAGTDRLLRLQRDNGTWRCSAAPSESQPVWATHDALFALRMILTASTRNLTSVALDSYRAHERSALDRLSLRLVTTQQLRQSAASVRRAWLTTAWMSALTVGVVLLALFQFGVLRGWESSSGFHRVVAAITSVLATVAAAIAPPIIAVEYRIRRRRGSVIASRGDD